MEIKLKTKVFSPKNPAIKIAVPAAIKIEAQKRTKKSLILKIN